MYVYANIIVCLHLYKNYLSFLINGKEMSFQKFESDKFCFGGRHRSSTVIIYGDITSKGSKVLIGYCSTCQRKQSMTVSGNTIQAEI